MNSSIVFHDLPAFSPKQELLASWLLECISIYNGSLTRLCYNFVDENQLLSINQKYLSHNTHTDIITFNYLDPPHISAEIYICETRIHENAVIYKQTIENELLRVVCHGLLHCIGYSDREEFQKKEMRKQESSCISLFHVKQNNYV